MIREAPPLFNSLLLPNIETVLQLKLLLRAKRSNLIIMPEIASSLTLLAMTV